jgi:hypothetical protein
MHVFSSLVQKISRIMFSHYFHVTIATTIILNMEYLVWNFYTSFVKKGEGLLHACISSRYLSVYILYVGFWVTTRP